MTAGEKNQEDLRFGTICEELMGWTSLKLKINLLLRNTITNRKTSH